MFDFLDKMDTKMIIKIALAALVLMCVLSTFSVSKASRRSKDAVVATLRGNSELKKQIKKIAKQEAKKEAKKEAKNVAKQEAEVVAEVVAKEEAKEVAKKEVKKEIKKVVA